MSEKKWLRVLDEMEELKEVVVYLSKYASETLNAKGWATTHLLTCLVGYISEERKTRHI